MKLNKTPWGRRWIPYTIAACAAVTLYVVLSHLGIVWSGLQSIFHFVAPVVWAIAIAYAVDILVSFYQRLFFRRLKKQKAGHLISIVLAIVTILIVIVLLAVNLIPQLIESITGLISNLSNYASSLGALMEDAQFEIAGYSIDLSEAAETLETLLQKVVSVVQTFLQNNVSSIINTGITIGKGFVNGIICIILAIYFLTGKYRLKKNLKAVFSMALSRRHYQQVSRFCAKCNHILRRYITCDMLDALIVGLVNYAFMLVAGMPYGMLISVVVGVANLVPTFGPIAGGVIGFFVLLLIRPWYALLFLLFTMILQTIDGYIIKPKMYGDTLGVSSLWVLVMLIVGGRVFGAIGVLLSVPVAAISDYIFRDMIWPWLKARRVRKTVEARSAPPPEQAQDAQEFIIPDPPAAEPAEEEKGK
ncbi:MAG: AI-2E family transporter [Oscillospiraceae bacterium]|nr:AI-2E family transporter [Oscillospiraceae bacterium]